jgi:hypothetical protein
VIQSGSFFLGWQGHHGWVDGSTERVDGYVTFPDPIRGDNLGQLDISCFSDECCTDPQEWDAARAAWRNGRVFVSNAEDHGCKTLIVPEQALTTALINEALRRFYKQCLFPAAI